MQYGKHALIRYATHPLKYHRKGSLSNLKTFVCRSVNVSQYPRVLEWKNKNEINPIA